jgi:DNA-binding CsgD family transcriptional regulator
MRLAGFTVHLPRVGSPARIDSAKEGCPMCADLGRPASPPRVTSLVGRAPELALLQAELDRARCGELRCVVLLGEPGVGKTRLARELTEQDGVVSLSARAYRSGVTTPFGLWSEAFERHLRGLDQRRVSELCSGFLDDLAVLLRSVAAVRGGEPDREQPRARLLEGMAVLLGNLAASGPVVVLLDDMHLADASSWEALSYLVRCLPDAGVLVLVTARAAELAVEPVGTEVLLALEQDGLARRLQLEPLPPAAIHDLAAAAIMGEPPPALVEWLSGRSRGNPLFALGLLRALLEEGADLAAPSLASLPEELTARVAGRVRALEAPSVELLELLAVLGRRVELRSLVGLAGQPPHAVARTLESLVRSRLVAEDERGADLVYEIAHPLVQDAIYEQIGGARRRLLHRAVGRELLAAGRLGEAAPHYVRSAAQGDAETVAVLCQAVHESEQREAYREALEILGSLVDVLPPGDPRWRDVVAALSWDARWVIDHRADAHAEIGIAALRRMDAVLESLPDLAARAVVKLRLASFLGWGPGSLAEAERVARAALDLFERAGDDRGRLLAEHELAWLRGLNGDLAAMAERAGRVADAAEALGDDVVMRRATRTCALAYVFCGRFSAADGSVSRSIEMARQAGDSYALVVSLVARAQAYAQEGRIAEAWEPLREAAALDPGWQDYGLREYSCVVQWMAGDFEKVVAGIQPVLALLPGVVSKRRGLGVAFAALSAAEMGDLGLATRIMDRLRPAYGGQDWVPYGLLVAYADATLQWRSGHTAEGLAAMWRTADRLRAADAMPLAGIVLAETAEAAAISGDRAAAVLAAAGLDAVAGAIDRYLYHALAGMGAAWTALAHSDAEGAAASAEQAVALLSGTGYRALSGRALEVLGRALARTERQRAVEVLTTAADTFAACGAVWRRRRVLEQLRALGPRGRTAAAALSGPSSLTGREREVASLAASGLTTREIGERLFLSERTVEGHLARIYAKLGVASKVQLVARAGDLGLARER